MSLLDISCLIFYVVPIAIQTSVQTMLKFDDLIRDTGLQSFNQSVNCLFLFFFSCQKKLEGASQDCRGGVKV
jgi:hypothetical protein